jgi:hypothetical protein
MAVLAVQGLYYLVTGAWSLVHLESFQWVTLDALVEAALIVAWGALLAG